MAKFVPKGSFEFMLIKGPQFFFKPFCNDKTWGFFKKRYLEISTNVLQRQKNIFSHKCWNKQAPRGYNAVTEDCG